MTWRLRPLLVLLLVLGLTGGHLATLQVVAWAGMLASRVQTSSLAEAVSTTFDGQHPCSLCLAVNTLQAADAPDTPVRKAPDGVDSKLVKKLDPLPMASATTQTAADGATVPYWDHETTPSAFVPGLELPPPRAG